MLRSLDRINGFRLHATDGRFGSVDDFLFDDRDWAVRYFVADTGTWLPGRRVLLSPVAIERAEWTSREVLVSLTRAEIEESPRIDAHRPVSRQEEQALTEHFGWPVYWGPQGFLGEQRYGRPDAPSAVVKAPHEQVSGTETAAHDPNLRSTREVGSYHIHATDGTIGHVRDFIADDENWIIRYVVVGTRNWLPGREVLISPTWVERVDWNAGEVHVSLTREEIRHSPEYDPSAPVNREYEAALYDYYGRPAYWE